MLSQLCAKHFVKHNGAEISQKSIRCQYLYSFLNAAITKYQGLGGLKTRNLFSHSFGIWKTKVLAGLVSSKASLSLACRWHLLALSSHGLFFMCSSGHLFVCPSLLFLVRHSQIRLHTLTASF